MARFPSPTCMPPARCWAATTTRVRVVLGFPSSLAGSPVVSPRGTKREGRPIWPRCIQRRLSSADIRVRWRAASMGQRNTSGKAGKVCLQEEVSLKGRKYRRRQGPLTETQIAEIWGRRAAGEGATRIARHMGRYVKSVGEYLHATGGGQPRPRKKSQMVLSQQEREEISRGLAATDSLRAIAVRIGRSPSTVSREVARNQGRQSYRAGKAEHAALARGRRPKPTKLGACPELRAEVVARLELNWSPQQISRYLKEEYPRHPLMQVSHETIYLSLYIQGRGLLRKELVKHLRRGHLIRQPKKHVRPGEGRIKDMVMISQPPAEAADRAVPGQWEGDLLLGTQTNAIGTLVERSTRFVMLFKLPSGINAESARLGLTQKILTLPENLRRSLAWDQGRVMIQHVRFTIETGLQVYFCDPRSPWQRGTNENTNGLLRQSFPR